MTWLCVCVCVLEMKHLGCGLTAVAPGFAGLLARAVSVFGAHGEMQIFEDADQHAHSFNLFYNTPVMCISKRRRQVLNAPT